MKEKKRMELFLQAITRVRELLKELETKESANKETVQVLKQEFVEHKTKYEKVKKTFICWDLFFSSIFSN